MVINILMVLLILIAIGSVVYLFRAFLRKYTKAKFAFASLSALSSLSILIILSLLAKETPLQSILIILAQIRGVNYTPSEPSSLELVVVCFVTFMLNNTVQNIFRNWDGPVTVEQYKRETRQEKTSLAADGIREVLRLLSRRPEPPIYSPSDRPKNTDELILPKDTLAWNYNLRDLFLLKSPSLYIPASDGWHDQENCWVGENKRNNNIVFIGCSIEKPNESQLIKFSNYVKKILSYHSVKIDCAEIYWGYKEEGQVFEWSESGITFKCESESALLDSLVDFQDYIFDITNRVERMSLPESDLNLTDVYVKSKCTIGKESKVEGEVESYLKSWLNEKSNKHVALLGEYGQGKSTCALMFTHHLLTETHSNNYRIPILIELRGKAPSTMSPEELLATWAVNYRIDPMAIKKLLIAGRLLLIFDGFDEMAFISQGDTRIAHFRKIWQLSYPKTKILITGRPNFFLDDSEMKSALGLRDDIPERQHCEAIYLQPFSVSQIKKALRQFKDETQNEICDLAKSNPKFHDLASRPCLLYIIGLLWERPSMTALRERLNSASIIDLFINHSLERQEAKNRQGDRFMVLHTKERSFFMQGIASYMLANNLPNQISNSDLRACVTMLLDVIPDSILDNMDAMDDVCLKPLRERIGDDDVMLENLQTDVRTYGLLVNDPSKTGTMRFAHKSFMEFLVAKVLATAIAPPGDESSIALRNSQELYLGELLKHREAFSFFAEILKETYDKTNADEEEIVNYLLKTLSRTKFIYLVNRSMIGFIFNSKATIVIFLSRKIKNNLNKLNEESEVYIKQKKFVDTVNETFTERSKCYSLGLFLLLLIWPLPLSPTLNSIVRAWELCCFELGISSDAIAKLIGPFFNKSYLDFSRRQYLEGSTFVKLNGDPIEVLLKSISAIYVLDKKKRTNALTQTGRTLAALTRFSSLARWLCETLCLLIFSQNLRYFKVLKWKKYLFQKYI